MAGQPYNFDWIQEEARALKFGKMTLELDIRNGKVTKATIYDKKPSRTLEDSNSNGTDGKERKP